MDYALIKCHFGLEGHFITWQLHMPCYMQLNAEQRKEKKQKYILQRCACSDDMWSYNKVLNYEWAQKRTHRLLQQTRKSRNNLNFSGYIHKRVIQSIEHDTKVSSFNISCNLLDQRVPNKNQNPNEIASGTLLGKLLALLQLQFLHHLLSMFNRELQFLKQLPSTGNKSEPLRLGNQIDVSTVTS